MDSPVEEEIFEDWATSEVPKFPGQGEAREEARLTEADAADLRYQGSLSGIKFNKIFLHEYFPGRVPWVHHGLSAILGGRASTGRQYVPELHSLEDWEIAKLLSHFYSYENPKDPREDQRKYIFGLDSQGRIFMELTRFLLVMFPRGFSKTTYCGVATPLREICYQSNPFSAYVSETTGHAKMQLLNIRKELCDNPLLVACFGNLKPRLRDEAKWGSDFFETTTGMCMAARGTGGMVRGLMHRGNRPRKFLVDDLESTISVMSEVQRKKSLSWIYSDLIPALPKIKRNDGNWPGRIVMMATLLHHDAAAVHIQEDSTTWTTCLFGAVDDDGDSLWPEHSDKEDLIRERQSYQRQGLLDVFYREFFNQIRVEETAKFKQAYFQYGPITGKNIKYVIYMDPAISDDIDADHSVLTVAAIDLDIGHKYIVKQYGKVGMSEKEKEDLFFAWHKEYKCSKAGVESTGYQRALYNSLRSRMFRDGYIFELDPVPHGRGKAKYERIVGTLSSSYAAKLITHVTRLPTLETQLMDLRPGQGMPDDYADSAAGAMELIDEHFSAAANHTKVRGQKQERKMAKNAYKPMPKDWMEY